jgi:ABC-type uncharacterized transport system substrate-binding protein
MRELGYRDERDFVIEYRFLADGSVEHFKPLASELVGLGVDVIVTRGSPAVAAAQNATTTIPIVMAANAEPLALGVIDSLARPRGNVTGLSAFTIELVPKQVELLRDMVPTIRRIAAINNMGSPVGTVRWAAVRQIAQALGLEAGLFDVRTLEALELAFAAAVSGRAEGAVLGLDYVIRSNMRLVVELSVRHSLPAIYGSHEFVDAGGLASYGAKFPHLYFRAASFVDKILKGAKPSEIPVEQPTSVELVLNLKAARSLGVSISPALLARADEVIE